jgi:hypothetical protein
MSAISVAIDPNATGVGGIFTIIYDMGELRAARGN